jgi:hypothetical protein
MRAGISTKVRGSSIAMRFWTRLRNKPEVTGIG